MSAAETTNVNSHRVIGAVGLQMTSMDDVARIPARFDEKIRRGRYVSNTRGVDRSETVFVASNSISESGI